MDTNSTNQLEENYQSDSENLTGEERTKKFLKKLEIQHKLLKKMIDQDPTGLSSMDVNDDQQPVLHQNDPKAKQ